MVEKEEVLFDYFDEKGVANWSLLSLHHKRQALYLVDESLELNDVAKAFAKDQVENVKTWLTQGKVRPPTDEEIKNFEQSEVKYPFLIVQPFVLFQLGHELN